MDPNETLRNIRAIIREELNETDGDRLASLDDLVQLVDSLDEWLSDGGFLPSDWDR